MFSHQWSTSVPALPTLLFLLCRFLSHACFLFYSAWFPFSVTGVRTADIPHRFVLQGALDGCFLEQQFLSFYIFSFFRFSSFTSRRYTRRHLTQTEGE